MATLQENHSDTATRLPIQDAYDQARRKYRQLRSSSASGKTRHDPAGLLDGLIMIAGSAWRLLIFGLAAVIIGLGVYHHFQGLSEHSSCSSFLNASPAAQTTLVNKMSVAHPSTDAYANDQGLGIVSLKMYCNLYPNNQVDGIYGGN